MAKYYRANNKRGYLNARIVPSDLRLELQDIDYGGGAKDRNIPVIEGKLLRLVIWGIQYPSPSADPDREIVSAEWLEHSSSGQVFDIVRAQEGTEAGDHYIGDNVALLLTADMSREILIFEDFEESIAGSIAYTDDTDEDGEMEVLALPPDDEVSTVIIPPSLKVNDSYTENIDSQKFVYWLGESDTWFAQTFTPDVEYNISGVILKLYRVIEPLIVGGTVDEEYCAWRIDDDGEVQQDLLGSFDDISYASAVCANGKFYVTKADDIWKFNKDGTVDTSFGINGVKSLGTISVRGLALDSSENLYAVIYSSASPTGVDTIWKLDSNGNVIWSTHRLSLSRGCTSVVVGSDGYVYAAGNKLGSNNKCGMKLNPVNGAVLVNYNYAGARHVAVDNFGYVYLSGSRTTYNLSRFTNDAGSFWTTDLGYFSLEDVHIQSGGSASATKVFVTGRDATNNKSVWKFNYDLSEKEADYNANSSFGISEDTDGNLLVSGNPNVAGEDGEYQIVKLSASNLSFISGIKFNDAGLKHVHRQGFNLPGVVIVSLRATNTGTGKPISSDICLGTTYGNNITGDSDGEEVTFIFSEYTLVPGTTYAIILKSPSGEFAHIGWKIDESGATYAGGSTFISSDTGSTWSPDPVAGDGDFYFKTLSGVPEEEVVEGYRKILVSGGVDEPPYWQFIWAEEVGGTKIPYLP